MNVFQDVTLVFSILNQLANYEADIVAVEAGATVNLPPIKLKIHGAEYDFNITATRAPGVTAFSSTPVEHVAPPAPTPAPVSTSAAAKTYTADEVKALLQSLQGAPSPNV